MEIRIKDAFRRATKRGVHFVHGRAESPYMVILEGDPAKRRVYEDWTQLDKRRSSDPAKWAPVPFVILVKGEKVTLTVEQRAQVVEMAG